MPLEQEMVTNHWNNRARSYQFNISRDFFRNKVDERWRKVLADAIGDTGPLEVLDAGCGPAVLTRLLLGLGHSVTAIDVSEAMLELARTSVEPGSKVNFHQASAEELPFEDESFDLVINRYVVWTLPDPVRAIREWRRVLKPGGRVCIIDGNWYYNYYHSPIRRAWNELTHLIYKVRSGFDKGQKLATNYAKELPSTWVLRPHWDLGILAGLGFENVRVVKNLERHIRQNRIKDRLKNPWHHQFLLMATKGEQSAE